MKSVFQSLSEVIRLANRGCQISTEQTEGLLHVVITAEDLQNMMSKWQIISQSKDK